MNNMNLYLYVDLLNEKENKLYFIHIQPSDYYALTF